MNGEMRSIGTGKMGTRLSVTAVAIRAAKGGFIVSYGEEVPLPLSQLQAHGIGGVSPYLESREAVCATLEDVNKLVAELLGPR